MEPIVCFKDLMQLEGREGYGRLRWERALQGELPHKCAMRC